MSTGPVGIPEIVAGVQMKKRSAREVADEALKQSERFQKPFNAFIRITAEIAREQARRVDERIKAGEVLPLAGVPFAVKDLFDAAGTATTYGSKVFVDRIRHADATAVKRLVDAGAVLIGKLNLHECAFG